MSMLVAVFNQTTGWSGKTITYEEAQRQFILEDHGPITAQNVLDYDAQGQVEWAREGLCEWARDFATWERTSRPETQAASQPSSEFADAPPAESAVSEAEHESPTSGETPAPPVAASSPLTSQPASGSPVPTVKPVTFGYAEYLGGHPTLGRKRSGNLWFTAQELGIGMRRPKVAVLQLSEVASVEVTGGQVAKSKVGAELVFGVFGGLGAKGAKNQATIAVYTKDDQIAYYLVDKKSVAQVQAAIAPLLRAVGIPFRDELVAQKQQEAFHDAVVQATQAAQGGGAPSTADELVKLAQLRDQGILTDEEFAAQKAKLLG